MLEYRLLMSIVYKQISTLLIWSDNYKPLADWYIATLSLNKVEELSHPKDTGVLLEFASGGPWLWIGQHDHVKGKNKDPHRIMYNINVDSVTDAHEELREKGVEFFAPPFKAPTMNKYFATFFDLDGNMLQLIGDE